VRSRQAISGKNALIHIRIRVFNRRGHRVRGEREKVPLGCVRLEMLDQHKKYTNGTPFVADLRQWSACLNQPEIGGAYYASRNSV
jgi:hypothetical protein